MNNPGDDINIDRYLATGDKVSDVYHEQSLQAPASLDNTILDYAHQAVESKPPSTARYWIPVALAASVIIGIFSFHAIQAPSDSLPGTLPADTAPAQQLASTSTIPEQHADKDKTAQQLATAPAASPSKLKSGVTTSPHKLDTSDVAQTPARQ